MKENRKPPPTSGVKEQSEVVVEAEDSGKTILRLPSEKSTEGRTQLTNQTNKNKSNGPRTNQRKAEDRETGN